MKNYYTIIILLIISSCSKIPVPSILSPNENKDVQKVSFGEQPTSYQNILKNYLITNLKNYKSAKVEFINKPSKLSIEHLGVNYSGYRVCLSINEKKGNHYIGHKNHFFLINNNNIDLHLYDSGLLTIPFGYCVSRNMKNQYFIDEIPEQVEEISVEAMDSIELSRKENMNYQKLKNELDKLKQENKELKKLDKNKIESNRNIVGDSAKIDNPNEVYNDEGNIFISCIFDNMSTTYIFNASKESFKLVNKLDIVVYKVKFNDAYIVATNKELQLTINRVTGKAALESNILKKGICNLANKTKI